MRGVGSFRRLATVTALTAMLVAALGVLVGCTKKGGQGPGTDAAGRDTEVQSGRGR